MVQVPQSDVAVKLPELIEDLDSNPVVISRGGEPVGALVSMRLFAHLRDILSAQPVAPSHKTGKQFQDQAAELSPAPAAMLQALLSQQNQPPAAPEQRIEQIERFERARDIMALELAHSLAQDNITVEEFLRDVLA